MKIIVTCGPSYEPMDKVRRLTNFSTGELGVILANELTERRHKVFCLKGVQSTTDLPIKKAYHLPFTTNADLAQQLHTLAQDQEIDAIFHAAALCDYRVEQISDINHAPLTSAKIASENSTLYVKLVSQRKLLPELRSLFPRAWIIGWKYELVGSRDQALQKAKNQIESAQTDGCCVNGAAYGSGFGFLASSGKVTNLTDKNALAFFLANELLHCKT